ncbi:hypothetical protein L6R53_09515 [Myxococcota bacterium]|nr:hypothetical protein [Myxococcota bacterium]
MIISPEISRKPVFLLAATVLGAGLIAGAVLLSTAEADHPMEADLISQRCASFSKATVWVAFTREGLLDANYKYLLHLHEDGRIAMDSVAGGRDRIYWDGQTLTRSRAVNPTPRVVDGYDQIIADVWSECRAGFANSTWTEAPYPVGILAGPSHFLGLDLPFPWADTLQIRVGYTPGNGVIQNIVLLDLSGNVLQDYGLVGENWNASFPAQALGPDVPPFRPPTWPGWIQKDAVAQEILDGMPPEELIISNRPIHRFDPDQ